MIIKLDTNLKDFLEKTIPNNTDIDKDMLIKRSIATFHLFDTTDNFEVFVTKCDSVQFEAENNNNTYFEVEVFVNQTNVLIEKMNEYMFKFEDCTNKEIEHYYKVWQEGGKYT